MIHFTERLKINEDYYTWIEKTKEATGFEIKDCPISVLSFLNGKGFLNEAAIHKEYLKEEENDAI